MAGYNKKPQNPNNFIILDFETGGVDIQECALTEVAAIAIDGATLEEIDRIDLFIKPNYDEDLLYTKEALEITNISMDLLHEEGLPIEEVVAELESFLAKANTYGAKRNQMKPIMVGHNFDFDAGCLQHLFFYGSNLDKKKANTRMEKCMKGKVDFYGNFMPARMDTLEMMKAWKQGEQKMMNYQLGTCTSELRIDLNGAHRAINDVEGNVALFKKQISAMRDGTGNSTEENSVRSKFKFPIIN